eukprot:575861-Pyramimonas_sp.AAC.2
MSACGAPGRVPRRETFEPSCPAMLNHVSRCASATTALRGCRSGSGGGCRGCQLRGIHRRRHARAGGSGSVSVARRGRRRPSGRRRVARESAWHAWRDAAGIVPGGSLAWRLSLHGHRPASRDGYVRFLSGCVALALADVGGDGALERQGLLHLQADLGQQRVGFFCVTMWCDGQHLVRDAVVPWCATALVSPQAQLCVQ